MDGSLTMKRQLDPIKGKMEKFRFRLWHVLRKVSLTYRINLWTVLVRPMFEQLLVLYYVKRSKIMRTEAQRLLKRSFKKFTLLRKNANDDFVDILMGFNLKGGQVK